MARYCIVLACMYSALAISEGTSPHHHSFFAPVATQSHGLPWPMPRKYSSSNTALPVDAGAFVFHAAGVSCDILQEAFVRYIKLTFGNRPGNKALVFKPRQRAGAISQLNVDIVKSCDQVYPALESDESYELTISAGNAMLTASEVWGALRGLETFSQIVYQDRNGEFMVNATNISDFPRFQHRGVLLDTSRHYLSVHTMKQNLDAMAMNKLNVFHWHIVDDPSFPFQSVLFPDLSNKGAYDPVTHVYTPTDVKEIIEYARLRGIRVIPEFDSPGHTQSWGLGQPGLLTPCYSQGSPDGSFGPVNPVPNSTFTFMSQLLQEIVNVFPDRYVHLGGDEVNFTCWKSNPDVTSFMNKMGFGQDYSKLEKYYVQNVLDILNKLNKASMIYEEVIDNGAIVQADTVVGVWKYNDAWASEMANITKLGYKTVLSSCWYLQIIKYGTDWPPYYTCDPHDFPGTAAQKALVMGGEAAIWGEWVDNTNMMPRTWPRASTVAERLWSDASVKDVQAATPRLEEMRCRMVSVLNIVKTLNKGSMIWQEVIDNGAYVQSDTVVEVWKGGWQDEMARVTKLGYKTLLSSCWYLNYISYGADWPKYYACDPQDFQGTVAQKALVMGGETCMWGLYVDDTNLISRLWPRASVVAERLWSDASLKDGQAAMPRLEEMRCRMVRRGFPAEPVNGASFCRREFHFVDRT